MTDKERLIDLLAPFAAPPDEYDELWKTDLIYAISQALGIVLELPDPDDDLDPSDYELQAKLPGSKSSAITCRQLKEEFSSDRRRRTNKARRIVGNSLRQAAPKQRSLDS